MSEQAQIVPQAERLGLDTSYGFDSNSKFNLLGWDWVSERMEQARNYWVATTRPDGKPHAAPVWGIWFDQTFYFSTGSTSRKGRNLIANPEIVVHLESGDEVVIFEGTIESFSDSIFFARFAEIYHSKYDFKPEFDPSNLYLKLNPRLVMAWLESDFVNSATRWRFR